MSLFPHNDNCPDVWCQVSNPPTLWAIGDENRLDVTYLENLRDTEDVILEEVQRFVMLTGLKPIFSGPLDVPQFPGSFVHETYVHPRFLDRKPSQMPRMRRAQ